MAKRKRLTAPSRPSKRSRRVEQHPHPDAEEGIEYNIRSIIDENKTQYKFDWEDNEVTGESYPQTWEPKANANQLAIDDWEDQKAKDPDLRHRIDINTGRISANGIGNSSRPATPRRTSTPVKPKRGRPRRVINSSPPPPPSPLRSQRPVPNGHFQAADDLPEIGESQHSASGDIAEELPDSTASSPLFVPDRSTARPAEELAHIQLSQPPSSYLAGAYEQVSQQVLSSDPVPTQPEASEFVPDPADTTGSTTNDTTEISAVLTTQSQPIATGPVATAESASRLVANFQSVPNSSSYRRSAAPTTSQSQSQPSAHRQVDTSGENHTHASEEIREGATPQEATSSQATEAEASLHSTPTDSESQSQYQATLQIHHETPIELQKEQADSQAANQSFAPISVQADTVSDLIADPATISGQSSSLQSNNDAATRSDSQGVTAYSGSQDVEPFEPTSAQAHTNTEANDTASEAAASSDLSQQRSQPGLSAEQLQDLRESQERPSTQALGYPEGSLRRQNSTKPHAQDEAGTSSTRADTAGVGFTNATQVPPTSIGAFTVTPPRRNAAHPTQRHPQPQRSSPFPFETQIQRPSSSSTRQISSQAAESRSQPLPTNITPINPSPATRVTRGNSVPITLAGPAFSSSPLPQAPSQSLAIGVFGESAPVRPLALSSPFRPQETASMDNSQILDGSGDDLFAKLQAMRKRHRQERALRNGGTPPSSTTSANAAVSPTSEPHPPPPPPTEQHAVSTQVPLVSIINGEDTSASNPPELGSPVLFAQDGRRSPSAVPHAEPLSVITQEDMTTAGRYETLLPQAQEYGSGVKNRHGSLTAGTPLKSTETIPDGENADLHTIPIAMSGSQRDHYPNTVYFYRHEVEAFLDSDRPDAELADRILDFINRMRRITMHPDLDNSETLTQYNVDPKHQADWDVKCSAKFRFLNELFSALKHANMKVAIVAHASRLVDMLETLLQGKEIPYERVGDSSSSEPQHRAKAILLETDSEVSDSDAVDLVIAMENSVRHDTPQIRTLRRKAADKWAPFVNLVVPKTVEHIERCLSSDLGPHAAVRALVSGIYQFRNEAGRLEDGQDPPKEVAQALAQYLTRTDNSIEWPIASLTLLQDLGSQTESDLQLDNPDLHRIGSKRSRESDEIGNDTIDLRKRARMDPQSSAAAGESTHISDSIHNTTQSNEAGVQASRPSTEDRLQKLLADALQRVDEHRQSLEDLQYRHEEQRTKLLEVTIERDAAISTATRSTELMNQQLNNISSLKTRRTELENELKDANARLLTHETPERAEFEAIRLEAVKAKQDQDRAENRLARVQQDLEYVRSHYQEASSTAQDLATQNTVLENQVAVYQNKTAGEQSKLRQMDLDAQSKNIRSENKQLRTMLKDREAAIKFRDEEIAKLKEATRGRMGTRGSSVPRTPRMGSPMKQDRRVGSRQASPATGDPKERERLGMLHPLRQAQS